MNATAKAGVALLVCFAVAGVIVVKQNQRQATGASVPAATGAPVALPPGAPAVQASTAPGAESRVSESGSAAPESGATANEVPKLLDLGSTTCIPCQKMKPILDELKTTYAGKLEVEFIDIYADEASAVKYEVEVIPTQIFFDADGKELYRHIGFYAKDDILAKWAELGVELEPVG